ncbi:NAD(P)H-hydrate dehydratase [Lysobacter sp. A6]|uniref:ADP-dependent (S)-NAD(P)H-hydrate dehydratase n=1 Tax=Noviluteimonas lactosilytica TaxID=2888523 RepID=A0ABS8JGD8_9GAMM|nr:NAD(P)H-hydrate dehydratase [Lysobacter lactosilyticus]MCC8362644.1 NAD(P)H-hydrate dehydratase [Lysobacter lactosilyticus]
MTPRRVTDALLRRWPLPDPAAMEGKEERGRVLIIGGSTRIPGAAMLAAIAAMRAGAGKLQVATSASIAMTMAVALPEAKLSGLPKDAHGEIARLGLDVDTDVERADAVLVGPGMLETPATRRFATCVLQRAKAVVLDAGALPAATEGSYAICVMTPHFGEMAALLGIDASDVEADPLGIARGFATEHGVTIVLKSAETVIANPEGRAWRHARGCTGLGTSGSGDVLAGLICGLIAQGAAPDQAAVWGVALHGRAGERLERSIGTTGFLAREIAGQVPAIRDAIDRGS